MMIEIKESVTNLTPFKQENLVHFDESSGYCQVKLKSEVYPLEAVQFAGHHMADMINIAIDMESGGKISVEMFLKEATNAKIRDIYWKFNETVLGYSVYLTQSNRNKVLRELILEKVLSIPVATD
jgi:hypothetical protein